MPPYINKCTQRSVNSRKGEDKTMNRQDNLRQQVKLAKALNDTWSYKAMSEVIGISTHAFYNWLNGSYNLSRSKEIELQSLVADLMP